MGFANWLKRKLHHTDRRVLLLGLPGCGKTTVADTLGASAGSKGDGQIDVRVCKRNGLNWHMWELDGTDATRVYWPHHFAGTQGVLFLIDASARGETTRRSALLELGALIIDQQLSEIPITVLLNKTDIGVDVSGLTRDVESVFSTSASSTNRGWQVFTVCATTGKGLADAIEYLAKTTKPL